MIGREPLNAEDEDTAPVTSSTMVDRSRPPVRRPYKRAAGPHAVLAATLLLLAAAPLAARTPTDSPEQPAQPVQPLDLGPAGADQVVSDVAARDDYFDPQTITVTVGEAVRWRNAGQRQHTTTSDDGYWNWGLVPGSGYSVRFLSPGTYPYHCVYHRTMGMTGNVVVLRGPGGVPTAPPPNPTIQPGQGGIVFDYHPDEAERAMTDLFVVEASGVGKQQITDTPELSEVQPSWAPDQRRVAYAASTSPSGAPPWGLWVLDTASGERKQVTMGPEHYDPDWRPDGSQLAFTSISRSAGLALTSEIAVIAPDGTGYRPLIRLVDPRSALINPTWSPDGQRIAFTVGSSLGGGEIYVMNANGSGARRLITHPGWDDVEQEWSPNGRYLAFASGVSRIGATPHDIWVVDLVTGASGTVARHTSWDLRRPAWSPDGRHLVFTARFQDDPARWALYLVPATGGDITGPISLGVEPDWASESLVAFPTPMAGVTLTPDPPGTPEPPPPFPTLMPEPTEPGPMPTFPPPPTFPPFTAEPLEPTPTLRPGTMTARIYLPMGAQGAVWGP